MESAIENCMGVAVCARGRSDTPQGPQRVTGDRQEAERHSRLGGPEEYKRSTRSPAQAPCAGARGCAQILNPNEGEGD